METAIISSEQIKSVVNMKEAVGIIEQTFRDHGNEKVVMPAKINLNMGERGEWPHFYGSANSMPAYVNSQKAMGIKFASGYKKNREKGLPFIFATIVLTDPETGYPIAVMDGTYITAVRTGASAAIAVKYLALKDAKTIGVIGAGLQCRMALRAINEVMDIKEARITDINKDAAEKCAEEMSRELGFDAKAVDTNREAVENSDVIVTVTTADQPLVMKEWLKTGALVVSLGSYQELEEQIPITANKLVVDNWAQNSHRGELVKLIEEGRISRDNIYSELGYIVAGKMPGRIKEDEMICACIIGMGSLDIAMAKLVYDKLKGAEDVLKFNLV